jgi:hypothetical protein
MGEMGVVRGMVFLGVVTVLTEGLVLKSIKSGAAASV